MQHLSPGSPKGTQASLLDSRDVKSRQGSSRCIELSHMLHRLCGAPSIPLSFNLAMYSPGDTLNALATAPKGLSLPTPSVYRLLCGLPGYLILFDTHTFAI